jgi:putative glycosyltransferase (TIGR04372 family)
VFFLLGLLTIGMLKAVRPVTKVRIGVLHNYQVIGHLAWNTELYLRRRAREKDIGKEFHVLLTGRPANRQLLTMIRRRVAVVENRFLVEIYKRARARVRGADCWLDLQANFNKYDEFNNIPPQLAFTPAEEAMGRTLLQTIGIEPGQPFVCFHSRDDAYRMATNQPSHTSMKDTFHDFRDCSIHHYLPAAEYLTDQGLYALRMGSIVKERLESVNPAIVDYASKFRSDFGDVFLPARSKFFLGNTAGITAVAYIFGVPVALANCIPTGHLPNGEHDLFIPKKLWHTGKKRCLTFPEIVNSGADMWMGSHWYAEAGIEVIENTADEVLALAKEMNARLDGTWVPTEEDEHLQQRYRGLFPPGHHCYGFPSRVGAEFLRQNRELLQP